MSQQDNQGGQGGSAKPKGGLGRRIALGCGGAVAVFFALIVVLGIYGASLRKDAPGAASASSPAPAVSSAAASDSASSAAPAAAAAAPATAWVYTASADAMSDEQTKEACTTSTNQVSQKFPYHDTTGQLCLRQSPKYGLDAYVKLDDDGQILCGVEGCSLSVRFDKQPARQFPASSAADNSTNIIFINRTTGFIAALKTSQATAVEVTLFENGDQPLTFNTAGLKWP